MHCPKALLLVVALSACTSYTRLAAPTRLAISSRHAGKIVELKQSCYYGELYDENEMWLLSPYPFADTSHIVDTDGAPIHPHGQRGVIPMGTTFVVQRIEFPDSSAMAKRMLTTPRYNPWIYLTPVANTPAPMDRKAYILLLPMDLEKEADIEAAIARLLTNAGEAKTWLAARRPTIKTAIENKDVASGMTLDELTAALGTPQRWFSDTTAKGVVAEVAWYPSTEAWVVDGTVVETRKGRPVEQPKRALKQTPANAPASP